MTPQPALLLVMISILLFACGEQKKKRHNTTDPPLSRARLAFVAIGDARSELPHSRYSLSFSTDGRLQLEGDDRLWTADSIDGEWSEIHALHPAARAPESARSIHYFDSSTAIAIGSTTTIPDTSAIGSFIYVSWILHTTNAGKSWARIPFVDQNYMNIATTTSDGNVLAAGPNGKLFHSIDSGHTWRECTPPLRDVPFDRWEDEGSGGIGSVEMVSPSLWVAAAWRRNILRRTTDAGVTWSSVKTPFDQKGLPRRTFEGSLRRINRIAVVGSFIVIDQGGELWAANISDMKWQPAPASLRLFVSVPNHGTIIGVADDGRVVSIDSNLMVSPLSDRTIATLPVQIEVRGSEVFILDIHGAIYHIADGRMKYAYPLTSTEERPTFYRVHKRGNIWWGATVHHLYRSHTDTGGWYRVASLPMSIQKIAPRNGNEVIVIDGRGRNYEFRFDEMAFYTIPGLDGLDVIDIQQRGSTWIAYGGGYGHQWSEEDQTRHPIDVSWSQPDGFIRASNDSGRTWWSADEWPGEGIANAFLSTNGQVHSVSHSGRFRSIRLMENRGVVAIEEAQTGAPTIREVRSRHLYVTGSQAWMRTKIHHAPSDIRYTSDAGNTWTGVDSTEVIWNITPYRDGFVAIRDQRVIYVDGDGARNLPVPSDRPGRWTPTTVHAIDDRRILVGQMPEDSVWNPDLMVWVEHLIP